MIGIASKIVLVLSVCSWTVVLGCNEADLATCFKEYSESQEDFPKQCEVFQPCIDSAGFSQCATTIPYYASVQLVVDACAGIPCLYGFQKCSNQTVEKLTQFIGGSSSASILGALVCFCENQDENVNQTLKQFNDCITPVLQDCPASTKAQIEPQVPSMRTNIQQSLGNQMMCLSTSMVQGNCDCAKKGDECIGTHLGKNFMDKRGDYTFPTEEEPAYPGCLKYGTEEQIRAAYTCLEGLPAECGYKDFDLSSMMNFAAVLGNSDNDTDNQDPTAMIALLKGAKMPVAIDFVMLRYTCVEGCKDPNGVGLSGVGCLPEDLTKMKADDIKALTGQDKTDFCMKVKEASKCAGEKMSVCPFVALSVAGLIDGLKTGQTPPASVMGDIPIDLTMFATCDINFLEYTDFGDDVSGSAGLNSQLPIVLIVSMMAALRSIL